MNLVKTLKSDDFNIMRCNKLEILVPREPNITLTILLVKEFPKVKRRRGSSKARTPFKLYLSAPKNQPLTDGKHKIEHPDKGCMKQVPVFRLPEEDMSILYNEKVTLEKDVIYYKVSFE